MLLCYAGVFVTKVLIRLCVVERNKLMYTLYKGDYFPNHQNHTQFL